METELFSHFISRVFATQLLELECDQVQTYIAAYVEAEQKAADVGAVGPAIQIHLDQCPDCEEIYRALTYVVAFEAERGLPSDTTALAGRPEQS